MDSVVRKDCFYTGYRAYRGVIQVGPVTLGKNVMVGEKPASRISIR